MAPPPKANTKPVFTDLPLSKGSIRQSVLVRMPVHAQEMRSPPPNPLSMQRQINSSQAANNFRLAPPLVRQVGRVWDSPQGTEAQPHLSVLF